MTARPASRMRGISLIEALVALAVVGIGMIGMVGVQATLRSNADVAKQRSTAVRLLQSGTEEWRAFAQLEVDPSPDVVGYAELVAGTTVDAPVAVGNASFTRSRTVAELPAPLRGKALAATVGWDDRSGEAQAVQMSTVIAGIAPELAATLAIPPDGDPVRRPQRRHRGIPVLAKDLGDGTSAIKPPGAPDTVAWRFDNVTGLITLCSVDPAVAAQTSDLTTANLLCTAQNALRVSGYVRYALTPAQPTEADARSPQSEPVPAVTVAISRTDGGLAPICYSRAELAPGNYIQYDCAVPVTVTLADPTPDWSGSVSLAFNPADLLAADQAENSAGKYKFCSYARPGARVGNADFPGGGNLITLTAGGGSGFRTWAAGSRINVAFEDWLYVYTVSAAVALPAAGEVTQTIPVSGTLPGVGNPLSGAAFADVWPYANISVPLVNQNYLVIRAGNAPAAPAVDTAFSCPTSTVAHQPAS
jgi:Tfp pilus assembly protein PilV